MAPLFVYFSNKGFETSKSHFSTPGGVSAISFPHRGQNIVIGMFSAKILILPIIFSSNLDCTNISAAPRCTIPMCGIIYLSTFCLARPALNVNEEGTRSVEAPISRIARRVVTSDKHLISSIWTSGGSCLLMILSCNLNKFSHSSFLFSFSDAPPTWCSEQSIGTIRLIPHSRYFFPIKEEYSGGASGYVGA